MDITAEIISVGTELLLGDIVNTNAQFLSQELALMGVNVYMQTTVGDNPQRLKAAYEHAFETCNLVIATGGLGPTPDDLTKEIAAEYMGMELEMHQPSIKKIAGYFERTGREMAPNISKQAIMPIGATVLPNDHGIAPGCIIEKNNKTIVLLPGPPSEMRPMFTESVVPWLQAKTGTTLVSRNIHFVGIGEAPMAVIVEDLLDYKNPSVAPYAKTNECLLRISARAESQEAAHKLIAPVADEIYRRLGKYIYGEDDTTLEEAVVNLMREKGLTLATAESCTGGLLAGTLTNVAGASQVFLGGAVTYSNKEKMRAIKVKEATLSEFGAVSAETAAEMAAGVAAVTGADIGISTTGIAGPDGGTEEKPVGLVYLGISYQGKTATDKLLLSGNRERVRSRTVSLSLNLLRRVIIADDIAEAASYKEL